MAAAPASPPAAVWTAPLKIGFLNLANAKADEDVDAFRFGAREARLHASIRALNLDVLAASELRQCMDPTRQMQLAPAQIAMRLALGTGTELADARPQNLSELSFWRATVYNAGKLRMLVSGSEWAIPPVYGSDKVAERGVMLLFTQFAVREEKGDTTKFWVINSHMPLATAEKLKTIDWLNANAERVCKQRWKDEHPILIYGGDQNTFFPGPTLAQVDGKEMMEQFAVGGWIHASAGVKTSFRAFPHDPFRKLNPDGTSLLDHIFVNGAAGDRIVIHRSDAHDTGASDHFAVALSISFRKPAPSISTPPAPAPP